MQRSATLHKQGFLTTPQGIALIILVAVVIWSLSPVNPATVALLAVAGLFLLGLRQPVWAMAAILISQLTVTSYMVNPPFAVALTLRLLLLVVVGLVLWRLSAKAKIELGPKAKRVLIPASILIAISVVSNVVNSGFDYAFKDFRSTVVALLIVIFLAAVVRNTKHLKILCAVVFVGITASAVVGLMQHYQFLGLGQNTIIPEFLQSWGSQIRVPGMAETELELAYVLSAAIPAVLGIYLARGVESGMRKLLIVSMILMALALYFTYTRSALLAVVFGLPALVLFLRTRIRGEIILVVALLLIATIAMTGILENQYLGGRSASGQQESTMSRKILWQAGLGISADNPILGIGGGRFREVSVQYTSSVDQSLLSWEQEQYWGYTTLGTEAIHNDYLGVLVSYGILALIAYLWLFIAILRNLLDSHRESTSRFIKGLSIGLAAALVAYGVNAFYHNTMQTLPLLWILAGFSVVTAKLALSSRNKPKTAKERLESDPRGTNE